MWKQLFDFGKQLVSLTRQTQENKDAIKDIRQELKEVRQEIKELNQKVDRLTEVLQRVGFEFQHDREKAASERKILLLEIENRFLRFERGLPPGPQSEDPQES